MLYFWKSKQWNGHICQCLGLLTSVQMLLYAIAQGGCRITNAVRETALKVDSGRIKQQLPCRTGDSNPHCVTFRSDTLPAALMDCLAREWCQRFSPELLPCFSAVTHTGSPPSHQNDSLAVIGKVASLAGSYMLLATIP